MASPVSAARQGLFSASIPGAVESPAQLRLLGAFRLTSGAGAESTLSPRSQSLLAYLALRHDAPQSRRQLSFLLWPDSSEVRARNSLRQLLHQLRNAWPEADRFISTEASTVALYPGTGLEIDVAAYETAAAAASIADDGAPLAELRATLERAADLYRGDLLTGAYDDWLDPDRERLVSAQGRLLDRLIGLLEQQADYRAAIERGQQRLRLDPLDERTYRWLMRLHALNQDRAGALRVFHTCAAVLEEELGVEPEPATREAYEQVLRLGGGGAGGEAALPASGHLAASNAPSADAGPLVGRQHEWSALMSAWDRMSEGEAHLLLVSGEAGIGKSRLAAELRDWATRQGGLTASTRAYAAEGGLSFAPVADWLRSPAVGVRLPRLDVSSLTEISRLVPELLARRPDVPRPSARVEDWQRQPFFQALARAFLGADQPLLLVLDDIQWCDTDTLEWLHFLLRVDGRAKLLVAATLRRDEVDPRHPLAGVVADLRNAGQLTEVTLGPLDPQQTAELAAQVAGRELGRDRALYIHVETEGNPLFVVETVRAGMSEPPSEGLPPKVQAVIAARLAQLLEPIHAVVSLAATVGRAFTVDVIRESSDIDEGLLVDALDELTRRQLIRDQGNSVYDFAHDKIREVAYTEMTGARRRLLHRRVAEALERLNARSLDTVASQIAAQYAKAQLADRAAAYYRLAAEVALRVGANQEAIDLLRRGLTALESAAASPDRDSRELELRTALGVSLVATEGYGAPDVESVFMRCRQLCQLLGRPASPPMLRALAIVSLAKVRIDECHAFGEQLMTVAERDDDPVLRVEAHYAIAMAMLLSGAAEPARVQLECALVRYERSRSSVHIGQFSQDPAVVCGIRLSFALWILGDTEGALRRRSESLALADELAHPFSLAYALTWDAIQHQHHGDSEAARAQAEAAIRLGRDHRMPFWLGLGTVIRGWAVATRGNIEEGIDEIREGMAVFDATGSQSFVPYEMGLLAEQYGRLGEVERGLTLIAEAAAITEHTNERWSEPELFRRKGELLEAVGRDSEAETAYRHAIDAAHHQAARIFELRTASRLAETLLRQQRSGDVSALLRPMLRRFGAASGLPELDQARKLLRESSLITLP